MIEPFQSTPFLSSPFPTAEDLGTVLRSADNRTLEVLARLWLTEGIPAVFEQCPGVYEHLRGWLGNRLRVHPKEITLVGSCRLGYSLAGPTRFGRPFGKGSDLDLCLISPDVFHQVVQAFERFADDYRMNRVRARSEKEDGFWKSNIEFGARNIPRGFFDANKIPNLEPYPEARKISQTMWLIKEKLAVTEGAPSVRHASIRIYRDWSSCIKRLSLNLSTAVGG